MDLITPILPELIKLSPFIAVLFGFLVTVWNSLRKKDELLMSVMKEHQSSSLQMQREGLTAQNNNTDALRQLTTAFDKLCEKQEETVREVRSLRSTKQVNGSSRRIAVTNPPPTA